MLMSFGLFPFSIGTLAYQDLARRTQWRHAAGERFGARAANQYVGPGDETVSIGGTLVPEICGDASALDHLRAMGDTGEAWALVDGTGRVHGRFVIASVDERQSVFLDNGVPRKIDFTTDLGRIDG